MWRGGCGGEGVEEGACGGEGVEGVQILWREGEKWLQWVWKGRCVKEGRCTQYGGRGVHGVEGSVEGEVSMVWKEVWRGRCTWRGGGGIYSVKEGGVCRGRGMDGTY